jgi:Tol biopolymer transport system component
MDDAQMTSFERDLARRLQAHGAIEPRPANALAIARETMSTRRSVISMPWQWLPGPVRAAIVVALMASLILGLVVAGSRIVHRNQTLALPAGSSILFERFTQLGGGLFTMAADGTGVRQLTTLPRGVLKDADWSPDGRRIVFIDEQTEAMWITDADGSEAHTVGYCTQKLGCAHPAWSPDATRIAFSRAESRGDVIGPSAVGIYVLDVASGRVTPVVRLARPLLADVPRWSPDGTHLAIGVDRMDADANETGASVAVVPVSGGEPRFLTPFEQFGYVPDWNRTDGRIVFSVQVREAMSPEVPNDTWNLFIVNSDGSGLHRVTDVPVGTRLWFPTWTLDGRFVLAADQVKRVAVLVDPETGEVRPIGGVDLARPLLRPSP